MILYFHGGGYTFGNPGTHREHIARLVARTGTVATAPAYRLAPKNPFPAAVDDAIDSYRALLQCCSSPGEVIVAGDSAGAGLAVAMVHRARAEGLPLPAGLILFSPYMDLDHTSYTITTNATTDYLPLRELSQANDWYASEEQRMNPEVSPIRADLTGFPPMLVLVGGAEMMLGILYDLQRTQNETALISSSSSSRRCPMCGPSSYRGSQNRNERSSNVHSGYLESSTDLLTPIERKVSHPPCPRPFRSHSASATACGTPVADAMNSPIAGSRNRLGSA